MLVYKVADFQYMSCILIWQALCTQGPPRPARRPATWRICSPC